MPATTPGSEQKVSKQLDVLLAGSISMYPEPPTCEVAIEDFERLAIERLKGKGAKTSLSASSPGYVTAVANLVFAMRWAIEANTVPAMWPVVLKALEEARSKNTKEPELRVNSCCSFLSSFE